MSSPDSAREQPPRYKVTAQFVLADTMLGAGTIISGKPSQTGFWKGQILPDDVPEHQLRHLLDSGMVEDVGPARVEG